MIFVTVREKNSFPSIKVNSFFDFLFQGKGEDLKIVQDLVLGLL